MATKKYPTQFITYGVLLVDGQRTECNGPIRQTDKKTVGLRVEKIS